MLDSLRTRSSLRVGDSTYEIFRLGNLAHGGLDPSRLPFSLKILLENLLRREDGQTVTAAHIETVARWQPAAEPSAEIAFMPARVLMQDFTGVPAVVDLAAMRAATKRLGGDPARINPLLPAELVIDHSVQIDEQGHAGALLRNNEIEFARNHERYAFLRWGQTAFRNLAVVPPDTGIVHQINAEYLARVVFQAPDPRRPGVLQAYPDTVVGTDSHTTMINGLGVLGWGVGGIEAEAAMLGQPIPLLVPQVIGVRLAGQLRAGVTATDLVLTVTQILRALGVVGKLVEFFGPGVPSLPVADRATIANMAPEYGATCGLFPIDAETLGYLRLTGRPADSIRLVEAYCREQGMFAEPGQPEPSYTKVVDLDMGTVEASLAGPRRPQDRVPLAQVPAGFAAALPSLTKQAGESVAHAAVDPNVRNGSVVLAAITSCTNTSNPPLLIAAGLLAQKAVARGLRSQPWVKTSFAPGSQVVAAYLREAGVLSALEAARLPHRRVRMHDVHRQLRPAAARGLAGHRRRQSGRGLGALGKPQLRRPHPPRDPRQLPGLAAAGGGVRPRRPHRSRISKERPSAPAATANPSSSRTCGRARRRSPRSLRGRSSRACSKARTPRSSRAILAGVRSRSRPVRPTPGTIPRPTSSIRPISTPWPRRRPPSRRSGERACSRCWATASPPTTSRPRARSSRTARPGATSSGWGSSPRTSIRTAPAAATTRSWCAAPSPTCA